jgi:hypothetical protein
MSTIKTILFGAFATAALRGGWPAAAGSGQPPLFASSCPSPATQQAPEPIFKTEDGCYNMTFCPDDDYCWQICSTASTAACVNNVCQFTFPGGGGGPTGNNCPEQRHCLDSSHCVYFGGIYGTCVNNLCVC